ncbi:MAG: protein translocase subunit SecD [Gammaproteobacteria bacterium]|nr:protein translocase subunit SecD [Gammaproteobacteria bacterium]
MNKYPLWKNLLVLFVVVIGTLYSLPNLFGEDFALQISANRDLTKEQLQELQKQAEVILKNKNLAYKSIEQQQNGLLIRLRDSDDQLTARALIKSSLGESYIVALNLAPATPKWLTAIGAAPMKLGLDLRGGVHFLMEVDANAALVRYLESDVEEIRKQLREENIRYRGVTVKSKQAQDQQVQQGNTVQENTEIVIRLKTPEDLAKTKSVLQKQFGHLVVTDASDNDGQALLAKFVDSEKTRIRNYAMEQSISTLRKRVNELGVAEAIVQRQGTNRVVVELPGIQDTARAKDIIGKTATVEFRLAYPGRDYGDSAPVGYVLLPRQEDGYKEAVKNDVIITGESIIGAYADMDQENGRPSVSITLGGNSAPIRKFSQVTLENKGKPMATVYVETKIKEVPQTNNIINNTDNNTEAGNTDGKVIKEVSKQIISVATITTGLGKRFQITGLQSMQEAKNLALLLRAGALPAPVHIVSEQTIGPSLGKENIAMGLNSVMYGMIFVIVFMVLYYSIFGLIANVALFMNLVLLVAVCSLIGVTMTLPGIAGIVLTLGMAVDANVLIFERIREEIRLDTPIQASIKAGYEKAFATIVDSNVTTLIAAVVLFSIGSGAVKGFALVLTIGLLTSMFTAITGSRAIVNLLFGDKRLSKLPIGI